MKSDFIEPIRMKKGSETARILKASRDCKPDQYVREFVKNSIQAIQRAKVDDGKISVDVDWPIWDVTNLRPLFFSVIDNGVGLSPSDMNNLLNQLDSSSDLYIPGEENYGVGAKIAALARNKQGILYQSWQNGKGYQCRMLFDEKSDSFGMEKYQLQDGTFDTTLEIEDDFKPEEIGQHGTKVTLYGNAGDLDTFKKPDGIQGGETTWAFQYLNSRFFEIPDNITLKVRCDYNYDIDNATLNEKTKRIRETDKNSRNCRRVIYGHHQTMLKHTLENDEFGKNKLPNHGELALSDAVIYWYILDPERKASFRELITGHTCVVSESEVFQIRTSGRSRSADFGLIFSKKDVVLCIYTDKSKFSQNTARSDIVMNIDGSGAELPWIKWIDEFRSRIPKSLDVFEKKAANKIEPGDSESIKEKIRKFAKFYSMSAYRKSLGGEFMVDDNIFEGSSGHIKEGEGNTNNKSSGRGNIFGSVNDIHTLFTKDKGVEGISSKSLNIPEFRWVSLEKGREEGEMEDRAASYNEHSNIVLGNKDFVGFHDVEKTLLKNYESAHEAAAETIKNTVYEHFQFKLVELVVAALSLKGRRKWSHEDYQNAISPEALTTGVLTKYHSIVEIERLVRTKLNIKKDKENVIKATN